MYIVQRFKYKYFYTKKEMKQSVIYLMEAQIIIRLMFNI